jgi:hypothetical protein
MFAIIMKFGTQMRLFGSSCVCLWPPHHMHFFNALLLAAA